MARSCGEVVRRRAPSSDPWAPAPTWARTSVTSVRDDLGCDDQQPRQDWLAAMKRVVTAAEMRALDRATIDEIGIPAVTLMETAGRAIADAAVRMLGAGRGHIAVVCGPGNNGGDGFVAARVLRDRGLDAVAYLAVPREAIA